MKRIIHFVSAVCLVAIVFACDSGSSENESGDIPCIEGSVYLYCEGDPGLAVVSITLNGEVVENADVRVNGSSLEIGTASRTYTGAVTVKQGDECIFNISFGGNNFIEKINMPNLASISHSGDNPAQNISVSFSYESPVNKAELEIESIYTNSINEFLVSQTDSSSGIFTIPANTLMNPVEPVIVYVKGTNKKDLTTDSTGYIKAQSSEEYQILSVH